MVIFRNTLHILASDFYKIYWYPWHNALQIDDDKINGFRFCWKKVAIRFLVGMKQLKMVPFITIFILHPQELKVYSNLMKH